MVDPKFVEVFLQNYHEFNASSDVDSHIILWDIGIALWNAPLTTAERSVIQQLYLSPPEMPFRTNKKGRPSGGTTLTSVSIAGPNGGTSKDTVNTIKNSAIQKIASFLGEAYGV